MRSGMRVRALAIDVALAALLAACSRPGPAAKQEPVHTPPVSAILPPSLDIPDYVGAGACAECHRAEYEAWQRSPHGRSMAAASPQSVLASADGRPVSLADGTASFVREGDAFFVDLTAGGFHERRKVDLVLASGRQHQLYVVQGADGALTLLPIVWSTTIKDWLPLSSYQAADLDPGSPKYWGGQNMGKGCVSCHLSQWYRRTDGGDARDAYVDLSVNCEACHGPGAEHVRRRRAGRTDDVYRDLSKLGSVEESRVCGACHGFQLKRYVLPRAEDGLPQIFVLSLRSESLRVDGTQHGTAYQYPAHVLSAGFREKVLRCKDCHAPHGLEARDKNGDSAEGALSNKQCTACHEELVAAPRVTAHSHHRESVRCVDCHMSYSWVGDDDHKHQRTSDHSISVPHPEESIAYGTPNACTTCHAKKQAEWAVDALRRWKARDALGVRGWVETIALARKKAPGATSRLVELLSDRDTVPYLKASALDLLLVQPRDAALASVLAPYASDPDPYLRAAAIRALDVHDVAGRPRWRAMGLADAHPYVRMETFSMIDDVQTLSPESIDRQLDDVMQYMSPPNDGIIHVLTVRHRRKELREALALVDLLARVMTPGERQRFDLATVRARVEADLVKADAAPH